MNRHRSIVRSFNRAVTLRVGLFTDRFLGRDRPLGEARLIYEVGLQGAEIRELRSRLDLDSGYLSRLLRSLERQGFVEVTPIASDRRIRRVMLTPSGQSELAELNRRGDEFAEEMLQPLSNDQQHRLAAAMAEVEKLLSLPFIKIRTTDPASRDARWCLEQFTAELGKRFEGGFDPAKSISADRQELKSPHGAFVVASVDGRPIGCGGVKTLTPGVGSIKRMWVDGSVRGIGIGRRVLESLEEQAAGLGHTVLRLETNKSLSEAQKLYRRNGYLQVKPFNDEPFAHFWFEKTLKEPGC